MCRALVVMLPSGGSGTITSFTTISAIGGSAGSLPGMVTVWLTGMSLGTVNPEMPLSSMYPLLPFPVVRQRAA
nr:hypothetical protein [Amycolatopsis aidingensis]